MFEDIKRGAPSSRARDRGLTERHLERFFDPTIWKDFGDGPDVSLSRFCRYRWPINVLPRVSSPSIVIYFLDSNPKKRGSPEKLIFLPSDTLHGLGPHPTKTKTTKRRNIFIYFGSISVLRRILCGTKSGIYRKLQIVVCAGACWPSSVFTSPTVFQIDGEGKQESTRWFAQGLQWDH